MSLDNIRLTEHPHYSLAIVEFDPPDFPWMFSPAKADGNQHLRPWLVLLVLDRANVDLPSVDRLRPLPTVTIRAEVAAQELPDLSESWAWAHTQVMTEDTTPLESGLAWTIGWEPAERDFIGRAVLDAQRAAGAPSKLVALVLEGKGVLRNHQKVVTGAGEGEITSGSFSPTLGRSIALARIPASASGERCEVDIRGRLEPARIVKLPFVRNGEVKVAI